MELSCDSGQNVSYHDSNCSRSRSSLRLWASTGGTLDLSCFPLVRLESERESQRTAGASQLSGGVGVIRLSGVCPAVAKCGGISRDLPSGPGMCLKRRAEVRVGGGGGGGGRDRHWGNITRIVEGVRDRERKLWEMKRVRKKERKKERERVSETVSER